MISCGRSKPANRQWNGGSFISLSTQGGLDASARASAEIIVDSSVVPVLGGREERTGLRIVLLRSNWSIVLLLHSAGCQYGRRENAAGIFTLLLTNAVGPQTTFISSGNGELHHQTSIKQSGKRFAINMSNQTLAVETVTTLPS
jgi:hypothetical protein